MQKRGKIRFIANSCALSPAKVGGECRTLNPPLAATDDGVMMTSWKTRVGAATTGRSNIPPGNVTRYPGRRMNHDRLDVLYEDNHLLAVAKPAGLATMGTPAGVPTLLDAAKQYVKLRYQKPGNVYLGVVSRLDAPVTGVVVLARTSKAARRLTEQFRSHTVEKVYWALVEGQIEPTADECVDWVGQDERHRRMHIVGPKLPGAKEARLSYRQREVVRADSLLEV